MVRLLMFCLCVGSIFGILDDDQSLGVVPSAQVIRQFFNDAGFCYPHSREIADLQMKSTLPAVVFHRVTTYRLIDCQQTGSKNVWGLECFHNNCRYPIRPRSFFEVVGESNTRHLLLRWSGDQWEICKNEEQALQWLEEYNKQTRAYKDKVNLQLMLTKLAQKPSASPSAFHSVCEAVGKGHGLRSSAFVHEIIQSLDEDSIQRLLGKDSLAVFWRSFGFRFPIVGCNAFYDVFKDLEHHIWKLQQSLQRPGGDQIRQELREGKGSEAELDRRKMLL